MKKRSSDDAGLDMRLVKLSFTQFSLETLSGISRTLSDIVDTAEAASEDPVDSVETVLMRYDESILRTVLGIVLENANIFPKTLPTTLDVVTLLRWMNIVDTKKIFVFAKQNGIDILDVLTSAEVGEILVDGIITPSEFADWCNRNPTFFPIGLTHFKPLLEWITANARAASKIPHLAEYAITQRSLESKSLSDGFRDMHLLQSPSFIQQVIANARNMGF